jgi:predicted RNA-binding Zn-ribbon protein involved in translation (DUF1610 family)
MVPLIPFLVVALGIGVAVVVRGVRGQRVGDAPHCRACEYELTGLAELQDARCPECGAELSPATVARGERRRRPGQIFAGVAFVLAMGLLLAVVSSRAARSYDWYRLRPAGWLIDDVERGTSAARAMAELARREADGGRLAPGQRERLAELALRAQASPAPERVPLGDRLLDFLATAAAAGRLSEAQRERFFEQAMLLTLHARTPVAVGERVPFQLRRASRISATGGWWVSVETRGAAFDGTTFPFGGGRSTSSGVGAGGSGGASARATRPGTHTLTVQARVRVYQGGNHDESKGVLVHERDAELAVPVVVVDGPPPALRQIDDASLAPAILTSLRVQAPLTRYPDRLSGNLTVPGLPVDVAFEVFARTGGREYRMGALARAAAPVINLSTGFSTWGKENLPPPVDKVDVVFRSSEEVARGTVELTQFWKGEIVVPDVPVVPVTPQTTP